MGNTYSNLRVLASIDTWKWLSTKPLPKEFIKALKNQYGSQFSLNPLDKDRKFLPWVLTVHQPTTETIKRLKNIPSMKTFNIHIAYNFISSDVYATTTWLQHRIVQTYKHEHHISNRVGGSLYSKFNAKAERNHIIYNKPEISASRLEIRYSGRAARNLENKYDFTQPMSSDELLGLLKHECKLMELKDRVNPKLKALWRYRHATELVDDGKRQLLKALDWGDHIGVIEHDERKSVTNCNLNTKCSIHATLLDTISETKQMNTEIPKGMKIKRLPTGKAYGADDLKNWSSRRAMGKGGVFDRKGYRKQKKRAKKLSELAGRKVKSFQT